jgi:VanZ family protein
MGEGMGWARAVALTLVIITLYGASDEWHQSFVPMRSADVRDWITDMFGGTLGALGRRIAVSTASRRRRRLQR